MCPAPDAETKMMLNVSLAAAKSLFRIRPWSATILVPRGTANFITGPSMGLDTNRKQQSLCLACTRSNTARLETKRPPAHFVMASVLRGRAKVDRRGLDWLPTHRTVVELLRTVAAHDGVAAVDQHARSLVVAAHDALMCKACYRTAFETRMEEYMGPIQMLCPCCHVWLPCDV